MGMRWCVVRIGELEGQPNLELDLGSEAIVLEADMENMHQLNVFLAELHATLETQREHGDMRVPPVVVLISRLPAVVAASGSSGSGSSSTRGTSLEEERSALSTAQGQLHTFGVDEVVLKVGDACDIHLSVSMALRRFWQAQDAVEEQRAEGKAALVARERELQKHYAEDVWSCASELSVAAVLPPIDPTLPTKVQVGVTVRGLRISRVLGQGAFCIVTLAEHTESSEIEAVKLLSKTQHGTAKALLCVSREIEALGMLEHEHIVKLLGVMHGRRHLFVRMEYAGPWSLMSFLSRCDGHRVPLSHARRLYRQLSAGLAHCHSRGIAHCDIKPENIALDSRGRRLKLLDFGCVAPLDTTLAEARGTMPFLSPEALLAGSRGGFSPGPADIWAGGVVLLEMSAGIGAMNRALDWPTGVDATPRAGEEILSLLRRPATVHAALWPTGAPAELGQLLDAVLAARPEIRCSAAQVLRSRWLQRGGAGDATQGAGPEEEAALSPELLGEVVVPSPPRPRPGGASRRPGARLLSSAMSDPTPSPAASRESRSPGDVPTAAGSQEQGALRDQATRSTSTSRGQRTPDSGPE